MNAPAKVAWVPHDEGDMHRESWRETVRDAPKHARPVVQVDLYSNDRGALLEKLARMAGKAITYDLRAGSQPVDTVPWEHTLAMATEWLARNEESPHDCAGDVIVGLALMYTPRADRIVRSLEAVMRQSFGAARSMRPGLLTALCRATVMQCITGMPQPMPPRSSKRDRGLLLGFGVRCLWVMADRGLRRAAAALAQPLDTESVKAQDSHS